MFKRFALLAIAVVLLLPATPALADLTIAPLRVVFKGRDRSAVVTLVNVTNNLNTYRLSWTLYKMNENGQYDPVALDEKDPFSIDKMIVFSPRQVVIKPGQQQLIRLSLRRPENLPVGEYRGHLTFTRLARSAVNLDKSGEDRERPKGQKFGISVNLSFSIPIIVRNGSDDQLKVEMISPQLRIENAGNIQRPVLTMDLTRTAGTFSTYGTILVFWQPEGGKEKRIGFIQNVALYPEVKKRKVTVPINTTDHVAGGKIRVVYQGKYESQGTIWDEKSFPVAN